MCELFGFHSPRAQDVRGFLTEFYTHSERHPHGWGFASFQKNDWRIVTEPGTVKTYAQICLQSKRMK